MALRIILVIIAAVLPAAHFVRQSEFILMLLLYLGVVIWLTATIQIVQGHIFSGEAWARLVIILVAVILLTTVVGLLLNSPVIKEKCPD